PTTLVVQPATLVLQGPRAMQQLVISAKYADGSVRDVTPLADFKLDAEQAVRIDADGVLWAKANGATTLQVKVGNQVARVPVKVESVDKPAPLSFRHDVVAALNV